MSYTLTPENRQALQVTAGILLRCILFSIAIMLFWFGAALWMPNTIYNIQTVFFEISQTQFTLIYYGFLGLAKIIITFFFLMPYLAIRHLLATAK